MLKVNKFQGRSIVCLADEKTKDHLWQKGDTLWGTILKYTPKIVKLDSWEEYEYWLPEGVGVQSFSEKASISYEEWLESLYND